MAKNKKPKKQGKGHPKAAAINELLNKVRQPHGDADKQPLEHEKGNKAAPASQTDTNPHLSQKGRTKK